MYTDWFKLKRLPFRLRPDPEFLYLSGETGNVYETLRAAVAGGHGIVTLVGDQGVGKTTLLHALARERQGSVTVARIQQPNLTSQELIAALAEQFGLPATDGTGPAPAAALARFVAEETGHGRIVLILVDEAHRCSASTLRELLGLCARQPAPLVVLAGEPELLKNLAALETQGTPPGRVASLQLPALNATQIEGYIAYRLHIAGGGGRTLFEPETIPEVHRYTGGTPELINTLCDSAMALAEIHNQQRVGVTEIRDAVQELQWVEFSARAPLRAATNGAASNATGPATTPELEVLHSGRPLSRLTLKPGRLVVGRAEDAGLRLDSQLVSRQHCQIITTADQSFVEDLGSTNGILVNGRRRRLHRLIPQDKIVVGDHTLIYRETPTQGGG
jgi:general secretion pathway protein A